MNILSLLSTTIWNATIHIPGVEYVDGLFKDFLVKVLQTGPIPNHISFVMDGNRTFAKNNSLPLKEGHRRGADALLKVIECCINLGINNMTIYAFSIENFNRSKGEVDTIFELLVSKLAYIAEDNQFCKAKKLRVKIIGNRTLIPPKILRDIEDVERKTNEFTEHTLYVAFPYTSRDDITHSVQTIISKVSKGEILPEQVDEKLIEDNFYYEGEAGKVDILVRTSGHTRLSDYMLWQCHQDSVIELCNTLWPEYQFYSTWWTVFKWSYYKTLQIEDAEVMQTKKIGRSEVQKRYKTPVAKLPHPPQVSVTRE